MGRYGGSAGFIWGFGSGHTESYDVYTAIFTCKSKQICCVCWASQVDGLAIEAVVRGLWILETMVSVRTKVGMDLEEPSQRLRSMRCCGGFSRTTNIVVPDFSVSK